jgi:acetolactate synthase I/II/III large subunit
VRLREAVAAALAEEGVEVVFGVLGDGNLELIADLVERHGARFVAARHELAAVAMADGYARASGRIGVCTVTHGPGLTQVGTSLLTAARARSPVLLLAGATATAARYHAQRMDQRSFALACGAGHRVVSAPTWAADVRDALRAVRTGAGPTVAELAVDEAELAVEGDYAPVGPPDGHGGPRPDDIAALLTLVEGADRPVVLAGRGAVRAGARAALVRLADLLGAPLATSLLASGWFGGHPANLGLAGGFSAKTTREVLDRADLVLAFGASLNRFTMDHGRLLGSARVAHVDVDPAAFGAYRAPDLAVVADARLAAEALADGLSAARERWSGPVAVGPADGPGPFPDRDDGVDPRHIVARAAALLPDQRNVVVGIGHYSGWPVRAVPVPSPERLVLPWELGAVGLGLAAGLGVALARPDATTVVFEGDGGLYMALSELDTAVRESIRVVVVVLDDAAYGAELHLLAARGRSAELTLFDSPDLADVARSMGWSAWRATDGEALETALSEAASAAGPALVAVTTSREVVDDLVFAALQP